MLVTPFRNLQMCIVSSCGQDSAGFRHNQTVCISVQKLLFSGSRLLNHLRNPVVGSRSHNCIHFRNLFQDLLPVSLRQTSGHDQPFQLSLVFPFCHFKNRIHALFLGISDKTAGIYNNDIRLRLIIRKSISFFCEQAEHHL